MSSVIFSKIMKPNPPASPASINQCSPKCLSFYDELMKPKPAPPAASGPRSLVIEPAKPKRGSSRGYARDINHSAAITVAGSAKRGQATQRKATRITR
jgi:hypothetical protein